MEKVQNLTERVTQLLMALPSSCQNNNKVQPCCLAAFLALLFSFPSAGVHYKPPLQGAAVKSPSHKAPWYLALPHSRTLASLVSPVPPPPFLALLALCPLHRQAFIALWGQCGYSPAFHSSLREQEVRATGAFEREN